MGNIYDVLSQGVTVFAVALLVYGVRCLFADKLNPRWQFHLWWVVFFFALLPIKWLGEQSLVSFDQWMQTLRVRLELSLQSSYSSPWMPGNPNGLAMAKSWTDWLFLAYGVWVIGSIVFFLQSYVRLRLRLKKAVAVQVPLVTQVAETYGLPMPAQVLESRTAKTPFVVGVFRPKLVLPMGQPVDSLVILHELLHIKHRHVLHGWLTTILRCTYPLTWYFCNQMDNDRERACDQAVLEQLEGESRRDYGRILLSMVDNKGVHRPGVTAMANGAKHIKTRIGSIVNFRKYPRGMELVSFCMLIVMTVTLIGGNATATENFDQEEMALAYGQTHRATTPAGALDLYSQARYYEGHEPVRSLAYLAAATKPSDLESVYETRVMEPGYSYLEGPRFQGFGQDEDGNYLCQMVFFEINGHIGTYWFHTVLLEEEDGYWSAKAVEERTGTVDADTDEMLQTVPGTNIWSAEVAGHLVEVSQVNYFSVNGPLQQGNPVLWMDNTYAVTLPNPDGNFWSHYTRDQITVTNQSDKPSDIGRLTIQYDENYGDKTLNRNVALQPGESDFSNTGGGGFSHKNKVMWEDVKPTTSVSATIEIDGETYNVNLSRHQS